MKPIIKEKKAKKKKINWASVFRYVRTIWKNDACVECSIVPRKKNNYSGAKFWWVSIPVFVASMLLAMTPLAVHASQRTGSSLFAQQSFGIDTVLFDAFDTDEKNNSYVEYKGTSLDNVQFASHTAKLETSGEQTPRDDGGVGYYYLGFHKSLLPNSENSYSNTKDFDFYFINEGTTENFNKTLDHLKAKMPVLINDTTVNLDPESEKDRTHSFLAFTKNNVYLHFAGIKAAPQGYDLIGDYEYIQDGTFKEIIMKNVDDKNPFTSTVAMNNFKTFTDEIYENTRVAVTWAQAGVSIAVNAGVTLLLGFIMFFLTRGKQNPNRYIKFYETLNMAMWASFLPAVISLCFGFLFTGMEMMLYLVCFGFRAMWMSMRNLRPQAY